jgi:uncharacterized RDD family membrane protein YckC
MIDLKYSTFWRRFWAGMVDSLVFLPWMFFSDWIYARANSVPWLVFYFIVDSCIFVAYSILMHGRYGQTLGKMVCRVIVTDVTETPLSMRQAVLRDIFNLAFIPVSLAVGLPGILRGEQPFTPVDGDTSGLWIFGSFGVILFLVELVTMLTNSKRRALHDFIAGSVVIRTTYAFSSARSI